MTRYTRIESESEIGEMGIRNWHTVVVFNNVEFEQRKYRMAEGETLEATKQHESSKNSTLWKRNVVRACGFLVLS